MTAGFLMRTTARATCPKICRDMVGRTRLGACVISQLALNAPGAAPGAWRHRVHLLQARA